MTPEETIEGAKNAAAQHKLKKVLVKNGTDKEPAVHEHVAVKTVHVTTPGNACYPDLNETDLIALKKHAMINRLSIHEFSHEEIEEVKEVKGKKK